MTCDGHIGITHPRWTTFLRRAALSVVASVAVNVVHAESKGPPASVVTPCDNCDPARPVGADPDASEVGKHDDLDDRSIQIETMNQQLRMEKRRKDSLLHLYPDETAYSAARVRELEETDKPIRAAEDRVESLARERRRLAEATGLYAGKSLPSALKEQSQRVEVALQQARATLRNCRDERAAVGKSYDEELVVLRRLWAAQPKT